MSAAADRDSLHASIYAYFKSLSSSGAGGVVLNALEQEFPQVAAAPPADNPGLEVRYSSYPIHVKRIAELEKATRTAASTSSITPTSRKRKSETTTTTPAAKKPFKEEEPEVPWETRYEQLAYFQKGYGHCRVSRVYKLAPGLGRWVSNMRTIYKYVEYHKDQDENYDHHILTNERIARLESIGFEWTIKKEKPKSWDERLQDLKKFKQEFGNCRVPRNYQQDKGLGEWCHSQRNEYRKKTPLMMNDRMHKLNAIGFDWCLTNQRGKKVPWDERFEQLLDFKRKHGHVDVPNPAKSKQTESNNGNGAAVAEEEQAFRRWVKTQKASYHMWKQGKKCSLDRTRIKRLEEIGFDWGTKKNQKARDPNLHHRADPDNWNRRLGELEQYREMYGDCNVPHMWKMNKSLGIWVAEQRKQYRYLKEGKTSSLSLERRVALENLGFEWVRRLAKEPRQQTFSYRQQTWEAE